MDIENYKVIEDLYRDMKKEIDQQSATLKEKKYQIAEIDTYLESLLNKEQSDLRVFLPRKIEDVYHDVIEQNTQQKNKLITECDEIEKYMNMSKIRLERLEHILSDKSLMLHMKQLSVLDVQEKKGRE